MLVNYFGIRTSAIYRDSSIPSDKKSYVNFLHPEPNKWVKKVCMNIIVEWTLYVSAKGI